MCAWNVAREIHKVYTRWIVLDVIIYLNQCQQTHFYRQYLLISWKTFFFHICFSFFSEFNWLLLLFTLLCLPKFTISVQNPTCLQSSCNYSLFSLASYYSLCYYWLSVRSIDRQPEYRALTTDIVTEATYSQSTFNKY